MKNTMFLAVIFLAACSKGVPVQITQSQSQYIGTWQFFHEVKTKTDLELQNVLLVVQPDSRAKYMKCILSVHRGSGSNSATRSSREQVKLPGAVITELTADKMTLEKKVWIFHFHYQLAVNKAPYLDDGHWYLSVDNALLRKLNDSDSNGMGWTCPEIDDKASEISERRDPAV